MSTINKDTWCVIFNPLHGNRIKKNNKNNSVLALKKLENPYVLFTTEYSKHEIVIVEKAIKLGYRKFICIGGDGTLNQVINGLFKYAKDLLAEIKVGIIPMGTGNDLARHYNINKNLDRNIEILNKGKSVSHDIGKVTFEEKEYYFCILAGLGLDGYIVHSISKKRRFGSLEYLMASLRGFIKYNKPLVESKWNNTQESSPKQLAVVSLTTYCGGGMRVSNEPDPNDGLLDVTLVKDISKIDFLFNVNKLYNGKIHKHKKVEVFKTDRIKFETNDANLPYVQVDGELLGKGGFEAEIVPFPINFIVP